MWTKSSLDSPGWTSWAWRPAPGPGRSSSPSWCPAPCTWCWPPDSWSPDSCVSCQSRHLSQTETQLSASPDQPSPGHLAFSSGPQPGELRGKSFISSVLAEWTLANRLFICHSINSINIWFSFFYFKFPNQLMWLGKDVVFKLSFY